LSNKEKIIKQLIPSSNKGKKKPATLKASSSKSKKKGGLLHRIKAKLKKLKNKLKNKDEELELLKNKNYELYYRIIFDPSFFFLKNFLEKIS